jgi:hypothetical protein
MIEYHPKIQLFTTLIYFKKINSKNSGGPPCLCGKVVLYLNLFFKNKKIQKIVGDHLAT